MHKKQSDLSSKSKDFVNLWRNKYKEKVGVSYRVVFGRDHGVMRSLMSDYSNLQLRKLIDFAFSDHPAARYISSRGYPIPLFPSQCNRYWSVMNDAQSVIPESELKLNLSLTEDVRTAALYKFICQSNMDAILSYFDNEYYWNLLMAKMKHQHGSIPKKVLYFYEKWKSGQTIIRRAKREDRSIDNEISKG